MALSSLHGLTGPSSPRKSSATTDWPGAASQATTPRDSQGIFDENINSSAAADASKSSSSPRLAVDEEKALPVHRVKSSQYSENDPDDPHSWPLATKVFCTAVVAGNSFIGTFSSSAITPGFDDIASTLHCSSELAVLAYSIFVLGLAVGAPFASPASEAYGRRVVYLTCLPLFSLFILGTGFSTSIAALIVCRFFAGVFAAPAQSVGSASIADIWPPEQRTVPLSIFILTPFLAPSLAPIINGFVVEQKGWRWTSWVVLFFTVAVLVPTLFLPETYKKAILARRAATSSRVCKTQGNAPPSILAHIRAFLNNHLLRPLHMLATEPVVASFSIYIAFNFSLVYAFFAAFPYVWSTYYNYSLTTTGLLFLGLSIGGIGTFPILIAIERYHYAPKRAALHARLRASGAPAATVEAAKPEPEHRLFPAKLGGPLLPTALLLFGFSTAYRVHWIVPVAAEALFGAGNMLVFVSATMYLVEVYGARFGASAMAANTMLRYLLGCAFPLFAVQMFGGLGVQYACLLLGALSVLLAAVPWMLEACGQRFRLASLYQV